MCVLLPINHMPCTHTVSVWHHCIDAPSPGIEGHSPCLNVRQHDRPILLSKPCLKCGGDGSIARRGGVTGYTNGSRPSTPFDDTDDSGYQSGFNNEDEEESDLDDSSLPLNSQPLSQPLAMQTPPLHIRKRSRHNQDLKLKLKEGSATYRLRRESFDSITSSFNGQQEVAMEPETDVTRFTKTRRASIQSPIVVRSQVVRRKQSTLLHPSTPPMQTPRSFQTATSFSFSEVVEEADRVRPGMSRPRKDSSLLHPSRPTVPITSFAQYKTIMSFPPTKRDANETSISNMLQSFPTPPSTQQSRVNATQHAPSQPRRRRESILHSSLSDTEDEGFDEPPYAGFVHVRSMRNEDHERNEKEGTAARVVRAICRRVRPA